MSQTAGAKVKDRRAQNSAKSRARKCKPRATNTLHCTSRTHGHGMPLVQAIGFGISRKDIWINEVPASPATVNLKALTYDLNPKFVPMHDAHALLCCWTSAWAAAASATSGRPSVRPAWREGILRTMFSP